MPLGPIASHRQRARSFLPVLESLEDRLVLDVTGGSNMKYVAQLYQDLLQRNADPQGLLSWSQQLDAGRPRSQVVAAIEASPEYRNAWINRQYQTFLVRSVDPAGLLAFRSLLDKGTTYRDALLLILTSDEYWHNRAGGTEIMYLTALFHDLLGRDADLAERDLYARPGTVRADVVRAIFSSQEWSQREVQLLYQQYLFRPIEPGGQQLFGDSLRRGASPEEVLAEILGSEEHFQQAIQLPQAANVQIRHYQIVVGKLYAQILGRAPQLSEVGRWVDRFAATAAGGGHLDTVLVSFLNSPEALRTQVARWYQHYLEQSGTLDQLKALPAVVDSATALANGADFFDVQADILASDAFYTLAGGTDTGLATQLYQKVLDRDASATELDALVAQLSQGSRRSVVGTFLEQAEATATVAAHWFQDYLGEQSPIDRLKTDVQVSQWGIRLGEYRDYSALLAQLLSSVDYLGFPEDLFSLPQGGLAPPPGPFALPPDLQRGIKPSFASGTPIVTTSYFYWYTNQGWGNKYLLNLDGTDRLTDHPVDLQNLNYMNVDWHKDQLQDMEDAGIDVVLAVWHGSPFSDWQFNPETLALEQRQFDEFSDPGLRQMVKARQSLVDEGKHPPLIGMFYDTTVLTRNEKDYHVDLTTFGGKRWFYEAIRNFYSHIPASSWARIDGRPIVVLYHPSNALAVDETLVDSIQAMFVRDFGVRLYIITGNEETAPQILNPAGMKLWADLMTADNYYSVLASFLANDAFYYVSGGTNEGYVRRLFDKLLSRQPSPDELANWVGAVQNTDRSTVAALLLRSPEAMRTQVARWYQYYLKRNQPLDVIKFGHEIDPWVTGLLSGVQPSTVLANILASDEFYWMSGQSNAALIDNVFQQAFLVNTTDTHGLQVLDPGHTNDASAWVNRLNTEPRVQVLADLLETSLAHQVMASSWHWFYLGQFNIGDADSVFEWGAALHAQFRGVAGFGPGYDQHNNKQRPPLSIPRRNGDLYRENWTALLAMHKRSWIVHLETWNEYFEGTSISDTQEYGRLYIDLTRQFADIFHQNRP
jgi:hypothetical protein